MTAQRSLMADYVTVLLRAIEATKNEPAQLRGLVYELARVSLGKHILMRHDQIGSTKMQHHLYSLEAAIKKVENVLEKEEHLLRQDADVPLIEGPLGPIDDATIADELDGTTIEPAPKYNRTLVVSRMPSDRHFETHPLPALFEPSEIWQPVQTLRRSLKHDLSNARFLVQLLIAAMLGFAVFIGFVARPDYTIVLQPQGSAGSARGLPSAAGIDNGPTSRPEMGGQPKRPEVTSLGQVLNLELPTAYGVYAESGGKPTPLDLLPIRVPDPRVAISAIITRPSSTTFANGKISFAIYRRDLLSSAPDNVLIRVVARVAREIKFSGSGPAITTDVDGEWAVRGNSYQFEVAPIDGNPEMILVRAPKPEFSLPAGRYALVVKDQAFDFSIAGAIADAAQCLERADTLDGQIYSECRKMP